MSPITFPNYAIVNENPFKKSAERVQAGDQRRTQICVEAR